jgi:hypothetical protein
MRDVERALRRLPSNQQTAVRLIGVDGKSCEAAARLMGSSTAALRCRLGYRDRPRTIFQGGADATPSTCPSAPPQEAAHPDPVRLRLAEFAEPVPPDATARQYST